MISAKSSSRDLRLSPDFLRVFMVETGWQGVQAEYSTGSAVKGEPSSRSGCHHAAPLAAGPGLPPVHRMLRPARDYRELTLIVVAVDHLLDVVVVVVVAFVSDVLPVADPVADGGNGAGDWRDRLSLSPDSCRSPRHTGNYAAARAVGPEPVAHVATEVQVAALKPVTPVAVPRRTDQALSQATQWRTPVVGLTQGARRPGSD